MNFTLSFLTLIAFGTFSFARLRRYLHIFQQEEYDNKRFIKWIVSSLAVEFKLSLLVLITWVFSMSISGIPSFWWLTILSMAALFVFFREKNPVHEAKKKLVFTTRAKSIFALSFSMALILIVFVLWIRELLALLVTVQAPPFLLVLSNLLLRPFEKRKQDSFVHEAKLRLASVNPQVIGITGSFGKTSTKHILGHILTHSPQTLSSHPEVSTH